MTEVDDLYTDLDASPEACQPGYETQRLAALKNKRSMSRKPQTPFQNASMPVRAVSIRKFSWEVE